MARAHKSARASTRRASGKSTPRQPFKSSEFISSSDLEDDEPQIAFKLAAVPIPSPTSSSKPKTPSSKATKDKESRKSDTAALRGAKKISIASNTPKPAQNLSFSDNEDDGFDSDSDELPQPKPLKEPKRKEKAANSTPTPMPKIPIPVPSITSTTNAATTSTTSTIVTKEMSEPQEPRKRQKIALSEDNPAFVQIAARGSKRAIDITKPHANALPPSSKSAPTHRTGPLTVSESASFHAAINAYKVQHKLNEQAFARLIWSREKPKGFWPNFRDALPERTAMTTYRRLRQMFPLYVDREWTKEDDSELRMLQKQMPNQWVAIGNEMGRNGEDVRDRWRNHLELEEVVEKKVEGPWSREEEDKLVAEVEKGLVHMGRLEKDGRMKAFDFELREAGLTLAMLSERLGGRDRLSISNKWCYLQREWKKEKEMGIKMRRKEEKETIIEDSDVDDNEIMALKAKQTVKVPEANEKKKRKRGSTEDADNEEARKKQKPETKEPPEPLVLRKKYKMKQNVSTPCLDDQPQQTQFREKKKRLREIRFSDSEDSSSEEDVVTEVQAPKTVIAVSQLPTQASEDSEEELQEVPAQAERVVTPEREMQGEDYIQLLTPEKKKPKRDVNSSSDSSDSENSESEGEEDETETESGVAVDTEQLEDMEVDEPVEEEEEVPEVEPPARMARRKTDVTLTPGPEYKAEQEEEEDDDDEEEEEEAEVRLPEDQKWKKDVVPALEPESVHEQPEEAEKKKRKKKDALSALESETGTEQREQVPVVIAPEKRKKHKKDTPRTPEPKAATETEKPIAAPKEKKEKKKSVITFSDSEDSEQEAETQQPEDPIVQKEVLMVVTEKVQKKRKEKAACPTTESEGAPVQQEPMATSEKNKRKKNDAVNAPYLEASSAVESEVIVSEKKTKKKKPTFEAPEAQPKRIAEEEAPATEKIKKKKEEKHKHSTEASKSKGRPIELEALTVSVKKKEKGKTESKPVEEAVDASLMSIFLDAMGDVEDEEPEFSKQRGKKEKNEKREKKEKKEKKKKERKERKEREKAAAALVAPELDNFSPKPVEMEKSKGEETKGKKERKESAKKPASEAPNVSETQDDTPMYDVQSENTEPKEKKKRKKEKNELKEKEKAAALETSPPAPVETSPKKKRKRDQLGEKALAADGARDIDESPVPEKKQKKEKKEKKKKKETVEKVTAVDDTTPELEERTIYEKRHKKEKKEKKKKDVVESPTSEVHDTQPDEQPSSKRPRNETEQPASTQSSVKASETQLSASVTTDLPLSKKAQKRLEIAARKAARDASLATLSQIAIVPQSEFDCVPPSPVESAKAEPVKTQSSKAGSSEMPTQPTQTSKTSVYLASPSNSKIRSALSTRLAKDPFQHPKNLNWTSLVRGQYPGTSLNSLPPPEIIQAQYLQAASDDFKVWEWGWLIRDLKHYTSNQAGTEIDWKRVELEQGVWGKGAHKIWKKCKKMLKKEVGKGGKDLAVGDCCEVLEKVVQREVGKVKDA